MDFIVRLFRALANVRRLAILHFAVQNPGCKVTKIARELSLPQTIVSNYLKLLCEHGLAEKRPSGTYVLVSVGRPGDARHVVVRRVREILRRLFGSADVAGAARAVCPDTDSADWATIYEALCFDFTAYTHLRRLMILRLLDREGTMAMEEVRRQLSMSPLAARRQTDKLVRRGIISVKKGAQDDTITIRKKSFSWLRRQLLESVMSSLRGEG